MSHGMISRRERGKGVKRRGKRGGGMRYGRVRGEAVKRREERRGAMRGEWGKGEVHELIST